MVRGGHPAGGTCRDRGERSPKLGACRVRALVLAGTVLIAAAACGGSSGEADKDTGAGATSTTKNTEAGPTSTENTEAEATSTTSDSVPSSSSSVPATTTPFVPVSSDQWVVQSLETVANAAGYWEGTAAILNESTDVRDGNFVLTLKRGSDVVATLTGSATEVSGRTAAKVSLASTESFTAGEYSVEFEATFGF